MTLTFGLAPFASKPFGSFNFASPDVAKVLYWADFLKRFRIEVAGETVADSRQTKMLHETDDLMRLCVPPEDVRSDLLEKGGEAEGDPSLGGVRNWSLRAGDRMIDNLAISFERPPGRGGVAEGLFRL